MAQPKRLSVTLAALAAEERFDYWQEKCSLYFRPSLVHANDKASFCMHGTMANLGPLVLIRCGGSRQIYERDAETIVRDGMDFILLDTLLEGSGHAWHHQTKITLNPGDLLLNDLTQPSRFQLDQHERLTVSIPRALIAKSFPEIKQFHGTLLPNSLPSAQCLLNHMEQLDQLAEQADEQQGNALASGLASLIAVYFRALTKSSRNDDSDESSGSTTPSFSAILDYIDSHLDDRNLSVSQLVTRFQLSRTALYRLFESHGGIAEVIRERRLLCAYGLLLKPDHGYESKLLIRDLALNLGFTSEAHFSRLFKARFGLTARQLRQQGMN